MKYFYAKKVNLLVSVATVEMQHTRYGSTMSISSTNGYTYRFFGEEDKIKNVFESIIKKDFAESDEISLNSREKTL